MKCKVFGLKSIFIGTVIGLSGIQAHAACIAIATPFGGGLGTTSNPYLVCSSTHLDNVRLYGTANFKQTANITLPSGTFLPIPSFSGSFNGNNKKIRGFSYVTANDYVGLFEHVLPNATLTNVKLTEVEIGGAGFAGTLVGDNQGTLTGCNADGSIGAGYRVGGLVGFNNGGTIYRSSSTVLVSGFGLVGALVGDNYYGIIRESFSAGPASGTYWVGGLVGLNSYGTIVDSYSTGAVLSNGNYLANKIGGLVGWNQGTIQTSYSTAPAFPHGFTGALNLAMLVGQNDGTVTSSYYFRPDVLAVPTGPGTPLNRAQMGIGSNFVGFDFTTPLWKFVSINPLAPYYPQLKTPILNWQ